MRFSITSLRPWNEVYANLFLLSHPFLWYVCISGQIIKFIPGKHTFDVHIYILYTLYTYHIHIYIYVHMYMYMYVYKHVYVCICVHTCMCVYIYVHVCIYMYTHTYTHTCGFPCGSVVKNPPAMQECGFVPWVRKITGEGHGSPLIVTTPLGNS